MKKDKIFMIILPTAVSIFIIRWVVAFAFITGKDTTGIEHFGTGFFQLIDMITSIALIYLLFRALKIYKRKIYQIILFVVGSIFIFVFGALTEEFLTYFYHFKTPIGGCIYSEQCDILTLLAYEDPNYKDLAVFVDSDGLYNYYVKDDEGWVVDNTPYDASYEFSNGKIKVYIDKIKDKYFLDVFLLDDNINISDIKDNTELTFNSMKDPKSFYEAKGRYGKIIENIDNYEMEINEEKITMDDFKEHIPRIKVFPQH